MRFIIVFAALLTFSGQSFGQTYSGPDKEIQHILRNAVAFSSYVVEADYDKIVASYTNDGKIFPNRSDIMEGPEAIRSYWILPEGVSTKHHKLTPVEIKVIGDEAYDYGRYEGTTLRADGTESSWRGKYVVVWKKIDGDWKMYLDIWNSIDS